MLDQYVDAAIAFMNAPMSLVRSSAENTIGTKRGFFITGPPELFASGIFGCGAGYVVVGNPLPPSQSKLAVFGGGGPASYGTDESNVT